MYAKAALASLVARLVPTILVLTSLVQTASADLVGHWTFDNATDVPSLLADTSPAGADNSGAQTAGTAVAGVTGQIGGAMEMFGDQDINVGSSADFDTTTWTASMWLWVDTGVANSWRTAFGSWGGGPPNSMHIGMNDVGTWGDHGGGQTSGVDQITRGQWYHIVSVRTPNTQENSLWVNGVKQAQTSTGEPAIPGASLVYIGTKNGTDNDFDGRIDDLAYFNETLSPTQIATIYNGGLAGNNVVQSLIPEPSSMVLAAIGLLALLGMKRRRQG